MGKSKMVEGQESLRTAGSPAGDFCSATLFSEVDKDVCAYSTRLCVHTFGHCRRNGVTSEKCFR
jgi:hypothetical protein